MNASRSPVTVADVGLLTDIPDKLYFKIGEVVQLVGVEAHVLRYWEKEVAAIRPRMSASKQRRYRRRDVEIFREIRRLLQEEKYTLAGARKRLMPGERLSEAQVASPATTPLPAHRNAETETSADATQLRAIAALERPTAPTSEQWDRVRHGLRELIRLAGEHP